MAAGRHGARSGRPDARSAGRQWPRAPGTVRCSAPTWPLSGHRQARPAVRAMEASPRRPTEGRAHRLTEGPGVRTPSGTRKAPSNPSTRPRGAPVLVQGSRSDDTTSPAATRRAFGPERIWTGGPASGYPGTASARNRPAACATPTSGRQCRSRVAMYGRNPNGARRRTGTTPAGAGPPAGRPRGKEAVSGREAGDVRRVQPHHPVEQKGGGQEATDRADTAKGQGW